VRSHIPTASRIRFAFSFFFSSRRRHTRFSRDWSSDVCSSDLPIKSSNSSSEYIPIYSDDDFEDLIGAHFVKSVAYEIKGEEIPRSEERRVGKGGRAPRRPYRRDTTPGRPLTCPAQFRDDTHRL